VSHPEALESRQVLSTAVPGYLAPWVPTDLPVQNPITHQKEIVQAASLHPTNIYSPLQTNDAKIVSGIDRQGDLWTITVHGPGRVIVTDTTPNDGALDDDINTIQLIGTDPRTTYVTGLVQASPRTPGVGLPVNLEFTTQGTGTAALPPARILFNQLLATSGVHSIQLNGFILTNTVNPPVTSTTGVFLYGGVKTLSFQDIKAQLNTAPNGTIPTPIQIVIGTPNKPLKVEPSIYLNSINNLVYNGDTLGTLPTTPITTPTVQVIINGALQNFDIVSAGQGNIANYKVIPPVFTSASSEFTPGTAGYQFWFPVVGTTGRTAVQTTAVRNLKVHGSAVNLTVSSASQPFTSHTSGVRGIHTAYFGGTADAVGLDVDGPIHKLVFKRGLGNPEGVFTAKGTGGQQLPATIYGTFSGTATINGKTVTFPANSYAALGDLGGLVTATHIDQLDVGPANTIAITPQNPLFVQLYTHGWPIYATTAGEALTNAVITTSGSIGQVNVNGSLLNTEVKTGFDYISFTEGLEGTRAASQIRHLRVDGALLNSDVSATFRPANHHYDRRTGAAGNGSITGHVTGAALDTNGTTGLGNTGAGVFARHLRGRLPATP
jgi:hypothetical protein